MNCVLRTLLRSRIQQGYRANKSKDRVVYLEHFLDDFELLKLEIRLCVDLGILSIKHQAELAGLMDGIGKQITGWRNASR